MTLLERKLLRLVGYRLGPNKVSFIGIFQPISDAVKLANKQLNYLSNFSFFFYYLSASSILFSSLFIWFCLYREPVPISLKFSLLIFLLVLAFNSFNSIFCGWRTFGKFSLIGRLRTVSQLISYEAVLYICIFFILLLYCVFNFFSFNFFPYFFLSFIVPSCFYIWIPSFLAELNRTPYDFSEGESELVRGFNTEFGSRSFTFIFLSEYGYIVFFSLLTSFLFFWGSFSYFFFISFFFVIWIRSVLPRYRFDKLIILAWKFYLPFLTLFFIFCLFFLI